MMTKKNRLLSVLTSSIALILVLTMIVALVASCGDKKKPEQTTTPTQTVEWPNAGVYYFDAGSNEDTLTLSVGGSFALIVKGETLFSMAALDGRTPEEQEELDRKKRNRIPVTRGEKRAMIAAAFSVYGPMFLCMIGAFLLAALLLYFFLR